MDLAVLSPDASLLAAGVALDLAFGDPVYPLHPVRLMGKTLSGFESVLGRAGFSGYAGGILLFVFLSLVWCVGLSLLVVLVASYSHRAGQAMHVFLIYSLIALHDLIRHAWNVERVASAGDVAGARAAIAQLVGRDTSRMDLGACRRAAVESLSENLTDGFISVLFWYIVAGVPGMLLFKIVSTMDSMVGYKTARYLKFGWCGARLDDLLNLLPARLTWLLLSLVSLAIPKCSGMQGLRTGWQQHALVPGPNSGWSEATTAGALRRKLVGPIWAHGILVTEVWLGNASDPPLSSRADLVRAVILITGTGLAAAAIAIMLLIDAFRPRVVPFL